MIEQLSLFATPPPQTGLTCEYGEPWIGSHPLCAAEVDRGCAEFDRLVADGVYDAEGYTPNERKAQRKRLALMEATA